MLIHEIGAGEEADHVTDIGKTHGNQENNNFTTLDH